MSPFSSLAGTAETGAEADASLGTSSALGSTADTVYRSWEAAAVGARAPDEEPVMRVTCRADEERTAPWKRHNDDMGKNAVRGPAHKRPGQSAGAVPDDGGRNVGVGLAGGAFTCLRV